MSIQSLNPATAVVDKHITRTTGWTMYLIGI